MCFWRYVQEIEIIKTGEKISLKNGKCPAVATNIRISTIYQDPDSGLLYYKYWGLKVEDPVLGILKKDKDYRVTKSLSCSEYEQLPFEERYPIEEISPYANEFTLKELNERLE